MPMRFRGRTCRQRGFIVSTELLLIFTILVIGSIVGVIAVRNAVLRHVEIREAAKLKVKDSTVPDPLILGRPVNYDLCEAPQIFCPDFGFDEDNNGMAAVPGDSAGLRALVGIRPDRFVTRNQIYFTGDGCSGDAYLAPPPIPGSPNFPPTLPVGYFNCGIQLDTGGDPVCYGAGPPSNWPCSLGTDCADGGRLYRSDGTTTATPTILSRWVSLNPDCAEIGAGLPGAELVVNGSFEDPPLPDGVFSDAGTGPPPPLPVGWTVVGQAGHWNPTIASFTPNPAFGGDNVPDGEHTSFVFAAFPTVEFTQSIAALPAGGTCTLRAWIGRRVVGADPLFPPSGVGTYAVLLADAGAVPIAGITGSITAASPEWQEFTTTFPVAGIAPYSLTLDSLVTGFPAPVSFDAVSLTCISPERPICDDAFETGSIALLPTLQVTDMDGVNVLAPYTPLFNVMAPVAPTFTFTAPEPEAAPAGPSSVTPTPPAPEGS